MAVGKECANNDNVHIYDTATGVELFGYVAKHASNWEPQWSADEKLCAVLFTNQIKMFTDGCFNAGTFAAAVAAVLSLAVHGAAPMMVVT